ncbi:hypothetical protein JG688_00000740 [Phytophthora aleatoria]|uniref:Uncharacterized protein n=1 Tax=Phytophthora aleatoria TaxID=2496075 RepID=A0A8J5MJ33_9STRA|nr:hypothetical protein JG688_00000740 [Phytophthora aleatoria]
MVVQLSVSPFGVTTRRRMSSSDRVRLLFSWRSCECGSAGSGIFQHCRLPGCLFSCNTVVFLLRDNRCPFEHPPELQVIHSSEKPTHWCGECSHKIASTQRAHKRKKTLMIQLIFRTCFLIAFVIYIPVGMSLAPESKRLSVADCLRENLDTTYCTDTKRLDDTGTTLDDDRTCKHCS